MSAPSILLVLFYSHFGTIEDSARLGLAYAAVAPVQLLLSMQHSSLILANSKSWDDCLKVRIRASWIGIIILGVFAIYTKELSIIAVALFRAGDFFYEPLFYSRVKNGLFKIAFSEAFIRFVFFVGTLSAIFSEDVRDLSFSIFILALFNCIITIAIFIVNTDLKLWPINGGALSDVILGVGAFIASISVNIPRYVLVGAEPLDLAFYSNMLTCLLGGSLIYTTLSNMLFSEMADAGIYGLRRYLGFSVLIAFFGAAMSLSLFVFSDKILLFLTKMVLGEKYVLYSHLVPYFLVFFFLLFLQHTVNSIYVALHFKFSVLYFNLIYAGLLLFFLVFIANNTAYDIIRITVLVTSALLCAMIIILGRHIKKSLDEAIFP